MDRRTFLLGTLASLTYVACGRSAEKDSVEIDSNAPPDGGVKADSSVDARTPAGPTSPAEKSHTYFPQGLASGDPRPDRVILWCRVEPQALGKPATGDIDLELIIAKDEALTDIVARQAVRALANDDHTTRVVPTGLEPNRHYYYRFAVGDVTTQVGRTKTAPAEDDAVPLRYAMCACQDYIGRNYHSWKALLEEPDDIDFVLYLGDYIYESVSDKRFQTAAKNRAIELPDGMDTSVAQDKSRMAAVTVADYRALYKAYRSDANLREVHRRFPFIITWDDHEFADDCWQDHSTSFDEKDPITKEFTTEQNTPRRQAANRAFSEYQPAEVAYTPGAAFPNDLKIYRKLRWGKLAEIFMTDQRAYRDDHVIPEGPIDLPVGKALRNSEIGARYFVRKSKFDEREAEKKPTLLGAEQKKWLVESITGSTATWKLWGNEVQMYQMALDLDQLPTIPAAIRYKVYINADQWDGFRSERAEILGAFRDANVENLVVCTGDIHAFFASELYVDFDAPEDTPIGVEFVTAGISSASLKVLVEGIAGNSSFAKVAEQWVNGADEALRATNPHLQYAGSNAYGYTLVRVDDEKVDVSFVHVSDPLEETGGVIERTDFRTYSKTNRIVTA